MGVIQVLDCTLRDGGYCNKWDFGFDNIKKIVAGLDKANIDIVECGFLTEKKGVDADKSLFDDLEKANGMLPASALNSMFVVMVNYGEYPLEKLPVYKGYGVSGIRVAFHKHDRQEALEYCKGIGDKGYKVFVQPMVSLGYSDKEFLEMIEYVNNMSPYAFYIVDSFGEMKRRDLTRLFSLIKHNLRDEILIGFHSHNNLQLAYSNAQVFVDMRVGREVIVDSSVYGMGRGAGNLNTELFVEYLNENHEGNYDVKPIFSIIDEILNEFYQRNYWGYSLSNYLSASYHSHPNYASFLDDKKILTLEDMHEIFKVLDDEKRVSYDEEYIEAVFKRYMQKGQAQEIHKAELQSFLKGKSVLLIAAGKSAVDDKEAIISLAKQENIVVVSVNYEYKFCPVDYIFLSNQRRYKELPLEARRKCIATSNIMADELYLQPGYQDLWMEDGIKGNAGIMAIRFFMSLGVEHFFLAGYDGYSLDNRNNFGDSRMEVVMKRDVLEESNREMTRALRMASQKVLLDFVSNPKNLQMH